MSEGNMSEGNDEFASSAKEDAEMMDMVRASAAVEQAALREQELNTRIEEQMAVLLRIANERRGKGQGSVKRAGRTAAWRRIRRRTSSRA